MATGIYEISKSIFSDTIQPTISESLRILPDSLLYGTGILSLITYQTPMLFLFGTVALSFIASNLIGKTFQTFMPQDVPPAKASDRCIPGLYSPTPARITLFSELANTSGFPSMPMFVLASVVSYCITAVYQQADVLKELGPDYQAKLPTILFLSLILILVLMFYLISNECNGFLIILASIAMGAILGGLLSTVIPIFFGQEATNILGVPLFLRRDKEGQPLYVCAVRNPTTQQ